MCLHLCPLQNTRASYPIEYIPNAKVNPIFMLNAIEDLPCPPAAPAPAHLSPYRFLLSAPQIPCMGGHPKNIIMLCCDAFGVLPPVAKLTPEQAGYYFISGYTAKVAGTEQGVTEPEATFS